MFQLNSLLGSLVSGALGARSKPHDQVSRFLHGGHKSFLNTGSILTAAALGFGAYEIWRTRGGNSPMNATIGGGSGMPPPLPPPLPGSGSRSTVEVVPNPSDGMPRIAALLVAAARSDGELGEAEYARILSEARSAGAGKDVLQELSNPRPLEAIVAGVNDPKLASDLYTLAFAVVRADANVLPAERAWLDRLAALLGLDTNSKTRLESEAAAGIARAS
jgi:uncharacterized membrane protein YebE (DUF533 family)